MADVLVLTAAAGVSDAAAEAAARAVGGVPGRLAATAVEIVGAGPMPDDLELPGIDMNRVPAVGRRKRMLIADMDSTIIGVECIDELADFAGLKAEVAAITEAAMRGDLDFEAALIGRVALLRGLPATVLERCYADRIRLNPGAKTLVRTMAAGGAETALVSGGFTYFCERVARDAGFGRSQANVLAIADGVLTGEVGRPILGREAKLAALRAIAAGSGLDAGDVLAVGDGANDADMVQAAGLGVAYNAKPALAAVANARLVHSDLTALLALQGIAAHEWQDPSIPGVIGGRDRTGDAP